jgi:hypothetical protein
MSKIEGRTSKIEGRTSKIEIPKAERQAYLRARGWQNHGTIWFHRRHGWIARELGDSWYYVRHTEIGAVRCELKNPTPPELRETLKPGDVLSESESGCCCGEEFRESRSVGPWTVKRIYWHGLGVETRPSREARLDK